MPALNRQPPTALLWDIDGTLLRGAKGAIDAWCAAAQTEFELALDWRRLDASGSTDLLIARQVCDQAGEPPTAAGRLLDRYLEELPPRLAEHPPQALNNARAVLTRVAEDPRYGNLFLTGNLRAAARAKLASCGLGDFRWDGGFAEHGPEREAVAAAARDLAIVLCGESAALVVIGDTPRDIRAARAIGAYVIAVATGSHAPETLAGHNPDAVLAGLPEPEDFISAVEALVSGRFGGYLT